MIGHPAPRSEPGWTAHPPARATGLVANPIAERDVWPGYVVHLPAGPMHDHGPRRCAIASAGGALPGDVRAARVCAYRQPPI